MLIKRRSPVEGSDISSADITPQSTYMKRRELLQSIGAAGLGAMAAPWATTASAFDSETDYAKLKFRPAQGRDAEGFFTDEKLTPFEDVIRYNNFYEFGTAKTDPAKYAHEMNTRPWTVTLEGEVDKPGVYDIDDLLKDFELEERIYRLRCVEAWSMVIPWVGFPLAALLKHAGLNSRSKYVYFETLVDKENMRGQRSFFSNIDWPYVEGLRIDEAMNPLTLMAVGLYGRVMPNQNGAPIRLVVPWKYGFKSIKSIVKIRVQERRPRTTWELLAPREYGFYANVNPEVDHPRWSQKTERRLPGGFFGAKRIDTLMFNGYGEQVAQLYQGMSLRRNF